MAEYEEFMAEAKAAAQAIKKRAGEREAKAQRATVPGLGGHSAQMLELTDEDKRFLDYVRSGEKKALVLDETGQYLVSPAIEHEIERRLAEEVTIRKLASQKTIDKDRVQTRSIGEAEVAWGRLETGSTIPESDLVPGAPQYRYLCDLYGLVKIGEDELADSGFDLVNILGDSFAMAIAEKENEAFLNGVGWEAGQQPDGICADSTLLGNAVTTAAAGAVTVEEFLDMVYACPAKHRKHGSFVVHSFTELALRKLRARGGSESDGLQGRFLWQPSVTEGRPATFLGYPIYADDQMGTLDGTGEVIAVFGDLQRGYRILDGKSFSIQRLSELYAEAGLVGFKVHARVGGYPIRPSNKTLVLLTEHA
jgi:HK97 family phage major capsid protein